jgi:three-Cys-motif partner protein
MLESHEFYRGREQTWVKHYVLRKYLQRFGPIIGFGHPSITYVDCFSGPWNTKSGDLSDTSFSIALEELRNARETHGQRGKPLRLRCVFLEQDRSRFSELKKFTDEVSDAEVLPLNSSFEEAIPEILRFLDQDRKTFPFIFIDPTGWTGFSMQDIAPLLKRQPGEVLINFMLDFIRRFIEHDFSRDSFSRLFGSDDFDEGLKDLQGWDRDDAIAQRYCRSLREVCGFNHVQRAVVLHPDMDKTHFLLIYGTRHARGVEVFKDAEKRAMDAQEASRARVEVHRKKQPLFNPEEMPESRHYMNLRDRYLLMARQTVGQNINDSESSAYDGLWEIALSYPLVWESDLRGWLDEWCREGLIDYVGMKPKERSLKRDKGHIVKRKMERVN